MSRYMLCFSMSLLLSLLTGCSVLSKEQTPSPSNRELITSDNMDRIAGMQWILQKMTVEGQDVPLTGEKPYIQFEPDGKVAGFASVNRYFGSVQIDKEGNLNWSPIGSTMMAGTEEMMKQENTYFKALPLTEQMTIEGIHLYLSSKDNQTELVFYVPVNL